MPIDSNGVYTSPSFYGNTSLKNMFTDDDLFNRIERSNGIYSDSYTANRWYSAFKRFGSMTPNISITNTREYIFFTKPDLHLFTPGTEELNEELSRMNFFRDCHKRYRAVMKQLQYSVYRGGAATTSNGWDSKVDTYSPFMNLLTNCLSSTTSLELPTLTGGFFETSQTIDGNKIFYRKTSVASDHDHEFSLEFEDCRDLTVYMLFKIYDEYQRVKADGLVTVPDQGYTLQKILHDQFSVYKFIVDNDGYTILFFAKLTGVMPLGAPRDAFSDMTSSTNGLKFTVPFKATYVEDSDPIILAEFNSLTNNISTDTTDIPLYDTEIGSVNGEWCTVPYVTRDNDASVDEARIYRLRWR